MPSDVNEWGGKIEGLDYVVCRHCGHKAATLAMHLKFSHQTNAKLYLGQFPGAPIRSDVCRENRSSAIAQAHKDNPTKGATKTVLCGECSYEHEVSKFDQVGAICLQCAHTKEEKRQADENAYWSSKTLGEEYVSCVGCGYKAVSLTSHIQNTHPEWVGCYPGQVTALFCGVRNKPRHGRQKSMRQKMSVSAKCWDIRYTERKASIPGAPRGAKVICLEREQLLPYALRNGKISIRGAMAGLKHNFNVIKRECERHGFLTYNRSIGQTLCLETVSKALGDASFKMEKTFPDFVHPRTGNRFRFDGYFPDYNLVVEFHGYQHYTFPSMYVKTTEKYFDLQERDRIKENLIHADPVLRYFLLREDEPYGSVDYVRGKLIDEGILAP